MLVAKFAAVFPHLDEPQRRLLMGVRPSAATPDTITGRCCSTTEASPLTA